MTTITNKTGGLIVRVINSTDWFGTAASFTSPNTTTAVNSIYFDSPDDPIRMAGFLTNMPGYTSVDQKFFLRQAKCDYYIRNNGPSGWMKIHTMYVRKNVSSSDFGTLTDLLQANTSVTVEHLYAPVTTSHVAQRYLKFGKVKLIKMNNGAIYHCKANMKYRNLKLVEVEPEGNSTNYLFVKGNKLLVFKWIPAPTMNSTITGVSGTDGISVSIWTQSYISAYVPGYNNPNAQLAGATVTGSTGTLMMPGAQGRWTPTANGL